VFYSLRGAVKLPVEEGIRSFCLGFENMKTDFITNLTMVSLGTRPIQREIPAQK
jgi:hypothetical protein